ncbi:MAG: AzlC family ABC transporter permease [Lachnospiraceae bacterium]|jgi:4-azaleucine resistance transporter AzlC|nr:AzlC family ABC transporter permease [Lachnospiraceae bacterium]
MTSSKWFRKGMKNGIPIAAGYFAVSFALGIAAKNVGMDAIQAGYMSVSMVASAGEFAAIGLIGSAAGILESILTSIVVNMRYFLMSVSLTQKLPEDVSPVHRFLLPLFVTDEIFGLSATVEGKLHPAYTYGIALPSISGWAAGTVLGVVVGNILPAWAGNALGVAMYGMFLAIIIPPAKVDHFIGLLVALSMGLSFLCSVLPYISKIGSGFRIILLTLILSALAAWIKPREVE